MSLSYDVGGEKVEGDGMNEFERHKLLAHCANCELNHDYCIECQRKTLIDFKAGMLAAAEIARDVQGCGGVGSVSARIKGKVEEVAKRLQEEEKGMSAKIEEKGDAMTEQEWRDNLKMGDSVILADVCRLTQGSVMRTTRTQIIVIHGGHERRYSRRNGRRIGPIHGWISMPEVKK